MFNMDSLQPRILCYPADTFRFRHALHCLGSNSSADIIIGFEHDDALAGRAEYLCSLHPGYACADHHELVIFFRRLLLSL